MGGVGEAVSFFGNVVDVGVCVGFAANLLRVQLIPVADSVRDVGGASFFDCNTLTESYTLKCRQRKRSSTTPQPQEPVTGRHLLVFV